jgi:hypothetical protein
MVPGQRKEKSKKKERTLAGTAPTSTVIHGGDMQAH